jgi:hypothetical protein
MHWDFFAVLSVLSGIVLIAAGLAGPVVGTVRERLGIFALGAFSFAYGIWVATQVSGFYMFSVAPAGLAIVIIVRAVQRAAQKPSTGQSSSDTASSAGTLSRAAAPGVPPAPYQPTAPQPAPSRPEAPGATQGRRVAVSTLRAAQPEPIRQAVYGRSTAFCPGFQLPGSAGLSVPTGSTDYYLSESLALGWSMTDGRPRLPLGEELFGIWQANARVKVAIGNDLNPTPPVQGVSWVTVLDGTGLIALSRRRVIGAVVDGDSLLGAFGRVGNTRIALWCLPLLHMSSVSVTPVGRGKGLILSSAEPAGHVTLTAISAAQVVRGQAVGVPPEHVAEMINRARAELSWSAPR